MRGRWRRRKELATAILLAAYSPSTDAKKRTGVRAVLNRCTTLRETRAAEMHLLVHYIAFNSAGFPYLVAAGAGAAGGAGGAPYGAA